MINARFCTPIPPYPRILSKALIWRQFFTLQSRLIHENYWRVNLWEKCKPKTLQFDGIQNSRFTFNSLELGWFEIFRYITGLYGLIWFGMVWYEYKYEKVIKNPETGFWSLHIIL